MILKVNTLLYIYHCWYPVCANNCFLGAGTRAGTCSGECNARSVAEIMLVYYTCDSRRYRANRRDVTYKVPAKPAALCLSSVGSGGRHIRISSWSASITTPGKAGNHTRR